MSCLSKEFKQQSPKPSPHLRRDQLEQDIADRDQLLCKFYFRSEPHIQHDSGTHNGSRMWWRGEDRGDDGTFTVRQLGERCAG